MTPFDPMAASLLAWRTALVFTTRSLAMWQTPADAPKLLAGYALEKQRAFTAGALAAARMAGQGASGPAILAAALAPADRRLRANAKRLAR